ncbi:VOC family protein [Candidatus Bipolaricaulota bacterium]|nr:VOC family protein [Candidatus Bipolaricaulota bacterium]
MNQSAEIELSSREVVILATDYEMLVPWYVNVLGFRITKEFKDGYRYCNLETKQGLRVGIAPATEAGVTPGDRSANTVLLQVEVPDVRVFLESLKRRGGTISFGPSFDTSGGFWFGGFVDPEGNAIWVVDENCP